MTRTTLEQAKACPRCDLPGRHVRNQRGRGGEKVMEMSCENESCKWYDTTWIIQLNRDGSIPERGPGDKDFPEKPDYQKQRARDNVRQVEQQMGDEGR